MFASHYYSGVCLFPIAGSVLTDPCLYVIRVVSYTWYYFQYHYGPKYSRRLMFTSELTLELYVWVEWLFPYSTVWSKSRAND